MAEACPDCGGAYTPCGCTSTSSAAGIYRLDTGEVHTWSMTRTPKSLICPVCGHTDREPQAAGNPCPKCEALPGMGVLEHIDPDILKALGPFGVEEAEARGDGDLWLYNKQPIALPNASTFSVVVKFGEGGKTEMPPEEVLRVTLLNFYKTTVTIE